MLIDQHRHTVIIRSDPQPAFFIHIQTAHIFNGIYILEQFKSGTFITEQSRIRTDPELTVFRLCDIIGFSGQQTFLFPILHLNIGIIISRFPCLHIFFLQQNTCHDKQHKQRPCLFSSPPASEQSDTQIHDLHAKQFIQKLHVELPEQIGKISRKSFVSTELYHLIPPDISTLSII